MITYSVQGDPAQINHLLEQLPGLVQSAAFEGGLRPAGKVVERRVLELTPDSDESGSTSKWSKETAAKRASELPLEKTTGTKVWRPKDGPAYAFVGYRWPKGNKGHFVVASSKGKARKEVFWGQENNSTFLRKIVLKRAIDERQNEAAAAFVTGVAKTTQRKLEGLASG